MNENLKMFLFRYLLICLDYDMEVSSCGCCSSPFIRYNDNGKQFIKLHEDVDEIEVDFEKQELSFVIHGKIYRMNITGEIINE